MGDYRIIWLYAAIFIDVWLIYDNESIIQINKIYSDYTTRQMLEYEPFVCTDTYKYNPIAKPNSKMITETCSDCVEYDEDGDDSKKCDGYRDNDNNDNNNSIFSYIIKSNGRRYYIDVNRMRQINCSNVTMQRKIKCVKVPKNIPDKNLAQYLKTKYNLNIRQIL